MYKSMLQDLSQKQLWDLPEYVTVRDGPPHLSRFSTTITVNNESFQSPSVGFRTLEEAQNEAAKVAYDYYTTATAASGSSTLTATNVDSHLVSEPPTSDGKDTNGKRHKDSSTSEDTQAKELRLSAAANSRPKDVSEGTSSSILNVHMLSGQQSSAMKQDLVLPASESMHKDVIEGAYSSILDIHVPSGQLSSGTKQIHTRHDYPCGCHDSSPLPTYETEKSGPPHIPNFVSTVEIGGKSFKGQIAKTKKLAEMNAAKADYICLTGEKLVKTFCPLCMVLVSLVWDDEALSMEERRMVSPKYQVHDETSQIELS